MKYSKICLLLILVIFLVVPYGISKKKSSNFRTYSANFLFETKQRPADVPENVEVIKDLVYMKAGERELKLDLFLPKDEKKIHPGIVFIHGGGWRGGSKSQFRPQGLYLASKGYVGICVEYQLSGEAKFPAAVEDVKCAVRWLRANAKKYKVDPNKIAAVGGSAGGHLAAVLGTTEKGDNLEGVGGYQRFSSKVNLVIDFNGVSDLSVMKGIGSAGKKNPVYEFLGGTYEEIPDVYKKASPINYVDKSDPPFLFLHGTADTTVPYEQSALFKELLNKAGVHAEIYSAEGAGHGFFNRPPFFEPTLKRMEKFLDRWFK